jgi:DNA-binding response OmpR family regulator
MIDKPRILVVEDEPAIRTGICDVLAFKGFAPTGVEDGKAGLREALDGDYAVLVLDVMLPGMDGFSICRAVREARPHQAILMLTAKGAEDDVLQGFSCGADDYVTKPFSVAQLMARIQALVRRAAPEPEAVSLRDIEVISFLARTPGRVVSRADLLREVWGYSRPDAIETRCVDMHIAKLRKKLRPLGAEPIDTVRGAGYRLREA